MSFGFQRLHAVRERAAGMFRRRGRARDVLTGLGVAGLAAVAGTAYVRHSIEAGLRPEFYQEEFGPAVALACGRGYINPDLATVPGLSAFLQRHTTRFECDAFPVSVGVRDLTGPQATWKYLLWSSALVWALTGDISWNTLVAMSGAFFGLTVALVYAGLRMVAGQMLSTIGALAVITSPMHLGELSQLRDYAKAPFMVGAGIVIAVLAARRLKTAVLVAWSTGFGLLLGVGAGFRNDLLICLPAFLMAVLIGAWRADARRLFRAAVALPAAVVAFVIAAAPLLGSYQQGGGASMPHVALLGLTSAFDDVLGLAQSPLYTFGHLYDDSYIAAVVAAHASRVQHTNVPITAYDETYDRAGSGLMQAVVTTLPADLVSRALASSLKVMELPSSNRADVEPPPFVRSPRLQGFFEARANLLRGRETVVLVIVGLAFLLIAVRDLSVAVPLLLLCLYFAGYPAIQFHERHYFHLNVISIASAAFLLANVWRGLRGLIQGGLAFSREDVARWALNAGGLVAAIAVMVALPLAALRSHQGRRVGALLAAYEQADREPLPVIERPASETMLALSVDALPARARAAAHIRTVQAEYLVAEFKPGACDAAVVVFTVRYDRSAGMADFASTFEVRPPQESGAPLLVFFPVYYFVGAPRGVPPTQAHYGFRSIDIQADERSCLSALSRIPNADVFPLLLNATLAPAWRRATPYQTFVGWDTVRTAEDTSIYVAPRGVNVRRPDLLAPVEPLLSSLLFQQAGTVSMPGPGRIEVRGTGGIGYAGPLTYLARFKPQPVRKGQRLLAEGVLRRGGFAIGVLSNERWIVQARVVTPGRFLVVAEAPVDAPDGVAIVANHNRGWSLRNDFEITRVGWVK